MWAIPGWLDNGKIGVQDVLITKLHAVDLIRLLLKRSLDMLPVLLPLKRWIWLYVQRSGLTGVSLCIQNVNILNVLAKN